MLDSKNLKDNDFLKGVGVGVLLVLSVAFIVQNVSGASFFGNTGSKTVLKTTGTQPTTDTTGTQPTTEVVIADITTDDYIYGNPEAPVTLVEYSDLECPFCASFHPTAQQIVDGSDGKVNWVYRHFPLRSIHPDAQKLAEAAECVGAQKGNEAYWNFIDYVFKNGTKVATVSAAANAVGANGAQVTECMNSGEMADIVNAQYDDAVNAGGRGTPYTVIVGPNGETIPLSGAVPASQIQAVVDSLL